jgi:uncharacterized protein
MVKQILLPLLAVMAVVAGVGYYYQNSSKINSRIRLPEVSAPTLSKTVSIGENIIKVEVANTDSSRQKGLSGRATLDADSGMLFVFDTNDVTPVFWMKDTLFPLDIIWINDNRIVKIDANVQPQDPETPDIQLVRYTSGVPVDYVLEVNAGYTSSRGIVVGDAVDLSKI